MNAVTAFTGHAADWAGKDFKTRVRSAAILGGDALPFDHPDATPMDILREMSALHEPALRAHLSSRAAMWRQATKIMAGAAKKAADTNAEMLDHDAQAVRAIWYPVTFHGRLTALEWSFSYLGFTPDQQKACLARGPIIHRM